MIGVPSRGRIPSVVPEDQVPFPVKAARTTLGYCQQTNSQRTLVIGFGSSTKVLVTCVDFVVDRGLRSYSLQDLTSYGFTAEKCATVATHVYLLVEGGFIEGGSVVLSRNCVMCAEEALNGTCSGLDVVPPVSVDAGAIHYGIPSTRINGSVVFPIFQSATFTEYDGDWAYMRPADTPNHRMLSRKLAQLEGTEDALVTGSGMSAISMALLSLLRPGDHLLIQAVTYGGTYELVHHELKELGISNTVVDASCADGWEAALQANSKVFYVEAISNPLAQVADLAAVAKFCSEKGLRSVVDATVPSPVLLQAARLGFHLVLHSATKYLNGHSDILAGVACGPASIIQRMRKKLTVYGAVLDPHACFLLDRGLKTLGVRVRRQNETAAVLASFLESQPQVEKVFYPGLPSSPAYALAQQLFEGRGGALFSFQLRGGAHAASLFCEAVHLATVAPSLGGVETLMTVPSLTSHAALGPEGRQAIGIAEGLIRVSVGLEPAEDLISDFKQALAALDEKLSNGSA
eukprot:jgi/Botrbrau1/21519/Bobra.174_2s0022.1